MRPIRFRAWDKVNRRWLREFQVMSFGAIRTLEFNDKAEWQDVGENIVLMQSTGLFDAKGREIWEGDVVLADNEVCLIGWSERYASFNIRKNGWLHDHFFGEAYEANECEVLGSIYENPELIGGHNE